MTVVTRRFVFLAALTALLSAPVWFLAPNLGRPSTLVVDDWLAGLTPDELDRAAANIRDFAPAHRKVLLARLSPAHRAEVWRQALLAFISSTPELSPGQKAQLQQIAEQLTADLFEGDGKHPERRARLIAAAEQTAKFLSHAQYTSLFYSPGPPREPGSPEPLPMRIRVTLYLERRFIVTARTEQCNCHDHNPNSWDDCPTTGYCQNPRSPYHPGITCDDTWFGCGQWGWESCEGICS